MALNPHRITDLVVEAVYHQGWGHGRPLQRERKQRVKWLRKKAKHDRAAQKLADKLAGCAKGTRCKSVACPECSRAAKRLLVKVALSFLRQQGAGGTIVCVTIVPRDGSTKPGGLNRHEHTRQIRRWKQRLDRAGVTWFLGASDWSFNEHEGDRYEPHWAHHFYGFTITDDPKQLKKRLQEQFPKTDAIPRPVKVKEWDGESTPLSYMLKAVFWRRIGRDNGQRYNKTNGGVRRCQVTDKQRLRSAERRELLVHLDRIGLQGRLMLRWLQVVQLSGSGARIVERGPNGRMRVSTKNEDFSP